jgi:hypothetical protein
VGPDEDLLDRHLVGRLAESTEEVLKHAGVALDVRSDPERRCFSMRKAYTAGFQPTRFS